jgi:hypothetical protein
MRFAVVAFASATTCTSGWGSWRRPPAAEPGCVFAGSTRRWARSRSARRGPARWRCWSTGLAPRRCRSCRPSRRSRAATRDRGRPARLRRLGQADQDPVSPALLRRGDMRTARRAEDRRGARRGQQDGRQGRDRAGAAPPRARHAPGAARPLARLASPPPLGAPAAPGRPQARADPTRPAPARKAIVRRVVPGAQSTWSSTAATSPSSSARGSCTMPCRGS